MRYSVLLVEDELTLARILKDALEMAGFVVELAGDGAEGVRRHFEIRPDILLVDVMMPKMSGFEMVRSIRQRDKKTPILFLTARTAVADVVAGFNLGANDYLKKPFAVPELVVRMKALLERTSAPVRSGGEEGQIAIGHFLFVAQSAELRFLPTDESSVIPRREAEILRMLCQRAGTVVPTQKILMDLWGDDDFFNTRSFQVLITRLRRRLARDPRIRIVNVRGLGYKLLTVPE